MKHILVYGFKSIQPKKRLEFNRKLYGYLDFSNFGSYTYSREGLLKPKTFERLAKGIVLMDNKPKNLIKFLKSYEANYRIFKVVA